jgi:four helix bundle protein
MASTVLFGSLMSEQAEQLKKRTRRLALDIIQMIKLLPALEPGPTIRRQLAKSATSMDMNYRASCRARSHAEFTAKIGVVAEEADETAEWLDVIAGGRLVTFPGLLQLRKESRELLAIFSASVGTARRKERSR